jgi:arsenate reductase-like glutaredoxin family protein
VYGRKKCRASQKALRFFRERSVKVQNLDLEEHPLGGRELDAWAQAAGGLENLLATAGAAYARRGLAHLECDLREELLADPGLLRTPVVRAGRQFVFGDDESGWKRLAASAKD